MSVNVREDTRIGLYILYHCCQEQKMTEYLHLIYSSLEISEFFIFLLQIITMLKMNNINPNTDGYVKKVRSCAA
jgi:hypothetical protein